MRLLLVLAALFAWIAWHNRPRYVTASVTVDNEPSYAGSSY